MMMGVGSFSQIHSRERRANEGELRQREGHGEEGGGDGFLLFRKYA